MVDVYQVLAYILLGLILGIVGQFIRIGIGLKKQFDRASEANTDISALFDKNQLLVSIIFAIFVGGTAGVLYISSNWDAISKGGAIFITSQFLITLISVGYAGTDFIEGLLTKPIGSTTAQKEKICAEKRAIAAEKALEDVKKTQALAK
jgi:hypothetical protein